MSLQSIFEGDHNTSFHVKSGQITSQTITVDEVTELSGGSGAIVEDVTHQGGRAYSLTDDPPIIDTEFTNKKYVDAAVIAGSVWSRVTGVPNYIEPKIIGDEIRSDFIQSQTGTKIDVGGVEIDTGSITLGLGATVDDIDDDGTLAASSSTKLATQAAIKTYVDTNVGASDIWKRVGTNIQPKVINDTVVGSALSGGDLYLDSTSDATKGSIFMGNLTITDDHIVPNTGAVMALRAGVTGVVALESNSGVSLFSVDEVTSNASVGFGLKMDYMTTDTLPYVDSSNIIQDVTLSPNLTLVAGTLDTVQAIQTTSSPTFADVNVSGDIVPTVTDTSYLGSSTNRFIDGYFIDANDENFQARDMNIEIRRLNVSNNNLREGASVLAYTTSYATVASVLTYTITDSSGTGVIGFHLDGKTIVHVGSTLSVDITSFAGTDASPKDVHISAINNGADVPILAASNTHSAVMHSDVALLKIGSVSVSSSTIYSEVAGGIIPDDILFNLSHRVYHQGSIYVDGCGITSTGSDVTIDAGTVMQILLERAGAQQQVSVDGLFSISSAGIYSTQTTFAFANYSNGTAIGGTKYFNIVLGILVNGETKIMALVQAEPTVEYNSLLAAKNDQYGTLVTYPSDPNLKKLFVPVCRLIIRAGVIQDLGGAVYHIDLRGINLGAGSSSAGGVTDHGELSGLADDDHTQYALLTGRPTDILKIHEIQEYQTDAGVILENILFRDGEINLGATETQIQSNSILTDGIDTITATSLLIGQSTATKVEIADSGVTTEIQGHTNIPTCTIGGTTAPTQGKLSIYGTDSSWINCSGISAYSNATIYSTFNIFPYGATDTYISNNCYSDNGIWKSSTTGGQQSQIWMDGGYVRYRGSHQTTINTPLVWDTTGIVQKYDGTVYIASAYANSVSGNPMGVSSTGEIGYIASAEKTKTNITILPDTEVLYTLVPKQFNYRKKINGVWTDEPEEPLHWGLIAEDIVNNDALVITQDTYTKVFNEDTKDYDDVINPNAGEITGVKRMSLIALCIKTIQQQKNTITILTSQISVLQSRDTSIEARLSALETYHSI